MSEALDAVLSEFENRTGLKVPGPMKAYYAQKRDPKYLEIDTPEAVLFMKLQYPPMPLRLMPVFTDAGGHYLGLYFSRRADVKPFAVGYDREEWLVFAVEKDLETFFNDPDFHSYDSPEWKDEGVIEDHEACRPLRMDVRDSEIPELELLKPLCFHHRDLQPTNEKLFGDLLSRFGTSHPVAAEIGKRFRSPLDIHDRRLWISLSHALCSMEEWGLAISALENCLEIQYKFPHCGKPHSPENQYSLEPEHDVEIFTLLREPVKRAGDGIDRLAMSGYMKSMGLSSESSVSGE